MNQHLQSILSFIEQDTNLSADEKKAILQSLKDADKEFEIINFKLDRTEKVKHTTAILLEETIEELEQKRKAVEAQNRELEIESALERVRTVAMSMNKPDDMLEVCKTIAQQLQLLGLKDIRNVQTAIFNEEKGTYMNYEYYAKHDKTFVTETQYTNHEKTSAFAEQMFKGKGEVYTTHIKSDEIKDWLAYQKSTNVFIDSYLENAGSLSYYWHSLGPVALGISTYVPLSDDDLQLFQRFLKVFDLSYRRYLDIEKAIAQAREAQIETCLERVRSRSMAMHNTSELQEVIHTVHKELLHLSIAIHGGSFIAINRDIATTLRCWGSGGTADTSAEVQLPLYEKPFCSNLINGIKNGPGFFTEEYTQEEKKDFFTFLFQHEPWSKLDAEQKEETLSSPGGYTRSCCVSQHTSIFIINHFGEKFSAADNDILKRFGKVFEQTYTRFLDLQKAEAQSREAQIQLALERGRTQSMIMQHSKELDDTLRVFHEQVLLLGINSAFSFLWLPDEEKNNHIFWATWTEDNNDATIFKSKAITYPLDRNEPATAQCLVDWKSGEPVFSYAVPPEAVEGYFAAWQELIAGVEKLTPKHFTNGLYYVEAFMKYGCFGVMLENDLTVDEKKILDRFATEFERAYTRFLDLQKAEAQAKEAQIEAALEKVRSRTMAMQSSNELQETAAVLFQEFKKLGTDNVYQVTIGIYNEDEQSIDFRVTSWAGSGEQENRSFNLDMNEPTVLQPSVAAWKANKKSLVVDLTGEALEGWINYRNKMSGVTISSKDTEGRRVISIAYFSRGHISISSPLPVSQETIKTLERFAAVFDGTYTRFLDLEKAEAQAREAQIETALERVRSRTLAMQKSDELAETAAEVFKQLISLGIEPNRLYIGIVKEESGDMEMWATDEDGTQVGKKFMFNKNENVSVKKLFDGWKAKEKSVIVDMQGKELEDYFHYLNNVMHIPFKGGLTQKRRVQSVAYFSKGFIGMASPDGQGGETIQLLERFAAVFNLTFTRFNDLKIAEAHAEQAEQDLIAIKEAKQKAEEALMELQVTQKQLIQSEKMASLGELTAGIAHEIQNPLNFVNNFSEVSNELMDEMNAEIEKGDLEEAKLIALDIKQNLEKINHHGKRADAIVKGMLQHSRSSSATKEPTDINKLADEYLRLAYHGLRAKDKSFNATLQTDYDETIGNINIIPQDMGRVILNLITNAFYVVDEKKKSGIEGYEPTVSVITKKINNRVEIKVADNGNGIPQKVLDKIFQPFFTTKPTGQGTGLGLSLSYDIVKAHGGELNVQTKEGEGTTFTIQIPANA
jgi:signal transduction histidine kinase/coenzyme F420-reducing hydrogenase delta subunit